MTEQKFNWAVIYDSRNYIEVYDKRPSFMPVRETLVKDVEIITNSNGTILLNGKEVVFHLIIENRPVSELDFIPAEYEIKHRRERFFSTRLIDYVESGWIEDKETRKYEAKFCSYAIRFFTNGEVLTTTLFVSSKNVSNLLYAMTAEMKNTSEVIQMKIRQRQSANLDILKLLSMIVERFPQLRFTQILTNLGLDKDLFYEESVDTLNNIKKQLERKFSL